MKKSRFKTVLFYAACLTLAELRLHICNSVFKYILILFYNLILVFRVTFSVKISTESSRPIWRFVFLSYMLLEMLILFFLV